MSDEIRVGDRFLVEVEVTKIYGSARDRRAICLPTGAHVHDTNDIATSTLLASKRLPRTIKVGDRVRERFGDCEVAGIGVVVAIDGTVAWTLYDSGVRRSPPLSDLTLADGDTP